MKAVIATVALGAVGIATSMADPVYSANVVGFVNVTTYPSWNLIANPLNGTNNAINTILPGVPEGAMVMMWDASLQTYSSLDIYLTGADAPSGDGWYDNDTVVPSTKVLGPGSAFFFNNPNPSTLQVTFVGEVPQGNLSTPVPPNYSLVSALTPSSPSLLPASGFPVVEGLQYFTFDGQHQVYTQKLDWLLVADGVPQDGWYTDDTTTYTPAPTPAPGAGFFLWSPSSSTLSWNMTFNVQ